MTGRVVPFAAEIRRCVGCKAEPPGNPHQSIEATALNYYAARRLPLAFVPPPERRPAVRITVRVRLADTAAALLPRRARAAGESPLRFAAAAQTRPAVPDRKFLTRNGRRLLYYEPLLESKEVALCCEPVCSPA
jgi:hypothetical protein